MYFGSQANEARENETGINGNLNKAFFDLLVISI